MSRRACCHRFDITGAASSSGWNDAFHAGYDKYPIEAWRAFLTEFGIQETVLTNP